LRLFSFGGYGLALAALALVGFGAYDRYPIISCSTYVIVVDKASSCLLLRKKVPLNSYHPFAGSVVNEAVSVAFEGTATEAPIAFFLVATTQLEKTTTILFQH